MTSAGGSSGIVEAGEDDSDADIGVASAEASERFVEESGSKPRVLMSVCAPCSEKWTNQSAGGSSGIVEAGEDDSDADIGVASAEASERFVEESGSKPRVLMSVCAPCSEKWTNQSAGGSSGIIEAGEDDSEADIGVASAEASERFVEESGSKPRVLRSACAPCSEKWTNQYLMSAVQEGLEVDIDIGPPACRGHFPDTKEERLLSGVEELTVPFADILCRLETVLPTPDHHAYLQQQSWPFDTVFPKLSADLQTASRRLVCPIVSGLILQSTAKVNFSRMSPKLVRTHIVENRRIKMAPLFLRLIA